MADGRSNLPFIAPTHILTAAHLAVTHKHRTRQPQQYMLNFAKLTLIGLLSITTVVMASGNKDGT